MRTKIICTIGPSINSVEMITAMAKEGMNVARLNFSHGTHEEHRQMIKIIKEVRKKLQIPLAIMLDTKGPEIRLRQVRNQQITLVAGQRWFLSKEKVEGDETQVSITPPDILDNLKEGMRVLFDDGYVCSTVVETGPKGVWVEIENGGTIRSGKGVNIPDSSLGLPAVTEKDVEDIRFGCAQEIDVIAASFVRSAEHLLEIRKLLAEEKRSDVLVLAKIENHEGVQNFDSILQVSDGIMIARGDLGVEVPLSRVPSLQKMMIRKCYLAGKPSVTATQMLESMINNPRPTRAEASDVANAIYDSTSAVMLSGETAIGKYPLAVLKVMKSIIRDAERDFDYQSFFDYHGKFVYHDVPSSLTLAAVKTAYSSNAKAIFAFTNSGATARLIARLRPSMPVIAMTPNQRSFHRMALFWGIEPLLSQECSTIDEAYRLTSAYAIESGVVSNGDLVVVTAGSPFGIKGTTNTMLVDSIGNVLVRGESGIGKRVEGHIAMVLSPEKKRPYEISGHILVMASCNEAYRPLIQQATAIILQNHVDDSESEKYALQTAQELGITAIVRADDATQVLKEEQLVTVDPEKALVYKGRVTE